MVFALALAWVLLVAVGLLFYSGLGVTWLLSYERTRGEELLIAPFAGLSLIVIVGYWCGGAGWSAGVALISTLVLSTCFNLLALVYRRRIPLAVKGHLFSFVLAFLALVVAVYPMWRSGRLGPIGSNGDQVLYANVTAYLEHGGLPAPPPSPSKPAVVQLFFVNWGTPLGFNYFHAFVNTLSGAEPHETFSLITALCIGLAVLAYRFSAGCVFGADRQGALLTALFAAASPTLMWIHYNDYGMHVMSLGLIPVALGLGVLALREENRKALFLSALTLSAAFTSYPLVAVPFAVAPLVTYGLLLHLLKRQSLTLTLLRAGGLGMLTVLSNLPGILHAGKFILPMSGFVRAKEFGDVDSYVPWAEVYGLSHHVLPEFTYPIPSVPHLPSIILTLIAFLFTLFGVWRAKGDGRLLFLSLVLVYVPFILWLRFGLDYPYGFFKALTFAVFPALMGLAHGAKELVMAGVRRKGLAAVAWTFVALLLTVDLMGLIDLSKRAAETIPDLRPLIELRRVTGLIPEDETIHVRDAEGTELLWITYFLHGSNLSLAHYSPYYLWRDWPFYRESIDADLVLVNKRAPLGEAWAAETVYENSQYKVLRKDLGIMVHLDFAETARPLGKSQALKVRLLQGGVLSINGRPFFLGSGRPGQSASLRLGAFVPKGSTISISSSDIQERIRPTRDLLVIDRPITGLPMEMTLANEGERSVLIPGWLELVSREGRLKNLLATQGIFSQFREEVIPGSGFFTVNGWHGLEEGKRRWSKIAALSVFRNPFKPAALKIGGFLPSQSGGKATVSLNGRVLGEVVDGGGFTRAYLIPQELLGLSSWGELEVRVNRTFTPRALNLSSDPRDLGIAITELTLLDLELPTSGAIDIGAKETRHYLGSGWSSDEKWGARTMVWSDAPESNLSIYLPKASDFTVALTLMPFTFPASPPQGVKMFVNGRLLGEVSLAEGDWQTYSVKLPRSFLSPGLNTLRFVYRYVTAPVKVLPDSQDSRTLAVAFDSITFRPAKIVQHGAPVD